MKKHGHILALISIILSITTCIMCISTMAVVLKNSKASIAAAPVETPAPVPQEDEPQAEQGPTFAGFDMVIGLENGTDWHFHMPLHNELDAPITLQALIISSYLHGENVGDTVFDGSRLNDLPIEKTIPAGGDGIFDDWHPLADYFDSRIYRYEFIAEDGREFVIEYHFEVTRDGAIADKDYSEDDSKDLITLRHEASFDVNVAPGVYWVPVNTLGGSRYTNAEVYQMRDMSPEDKRDKIDTLYEALQFYQISNFYAADDNIRLEENGIHWEHHKPGFDAVRTNGGCCATSANWLNYILDGNYEEVGYIATSQRDGSGHIFNYIKHDGWYYIADLTHYRTDWIATAVESGDLNDYYSSDFIAGNIHKVQDMQAYVDYVQANYGDPPGLCFMYTAENCLAIDSLHEQHGITIVYEDVPEVEINVIFDDTHDNLYYERIPAPTNYPSWAGEPGYDYGRR